MKTKNKRKAMAPTIGAIVPPEPDEPLDNLVAQEMIAAFRRGDVDAVQILGASPFRGGAPSASSPPGPSPGRPSTSTEGIPPAIRARVERDRQELEQMDPEAGADEQLLLRLVGDSLPAAMMLSELTERMVVHLPSLLDEPAALRALSSALRDTVTLRSSLLNRLQSVLATVASLRGQRRFLQRHRGRNGV